MTHNGNVNTFCATPIQVTETSFISAFTCNIYGHSCGNVLYFVTLDDLVVLNYHSSPIDLNVKVGIGVYFRNIIQIGKVLLPSM